MKPHEIIKRKNRDFFEIICTAYHEVIYYIGLQRFARQRQ